MARRSELVPVEGVTRNGTFGTTRLRLAVVIPTRNEEASLPATLASLMAQTDPAECLTVADGNSTDRTVALAVHYGAAVIGAGRRGRGGQIADIVARLAEDIVLVAHADMVFPPGALAAVRQALAHNPACPGGCLGHHFDRRRPLYRLIEWWDRRRALRGFSYGDQAQFFRRELLAGIGGFPDQPMMEDLELSRRLRQLGRPIYLDVPVRVSARRFEQFGYWRTVWLNLALRRAYRRRGVAACEAIYQRYYAVASPGSNGKRMSD